MGAPIQVAEVYNFDTKTWTTLPEMPVPRAASTGAVVKDDQIIVVGGVTTKQVPLNKVDCFDIKSNKWVEFPALPLGVVGPYVQLIDDKLYCVGGTDKKGCNQSVVYDFDHRRWNPLPQKPTPCYSCGGYLYERKLIIVGGRNGADPVQAVEALDLDTMQWERLAPMNAIRVFYGVIGIKEEIYVVGGLVPPGGRVQGGGALQHPRRHVVSDPRPQQQSAPTVRTGWWGTGWWWWGGSEGEGRSPRPWIRESASSTEEGASRSCLS